MATFNKPIITTQGLAMLKSELSGSAPLSFTKVIFTSDDYSQLSDTDVANLNDVKAKDITAQAQTFVGTDSTTKVRATADNRSSNQAFYIKGYALYAKQNGNETLFAVAVSDTSDYVPAFSNKQLSQVSYTFQFAISETDNITLSDVHDIPVTQADIQGLTTYVNSKSSDLTNLINNATNKSAQDTLSKANQYTDSQIADKATKKYVDNATKSANSYTDSKVSQANSAISDLSNKVDTKANNADLTSAVNNINANIEKKADQTEVDKLNERINGKSFPDLSLNINYMYQIPNGTIGGNKQELFKAHLKANHVYWVGVDNATPVVSYDGNISNGWVAGNYANFFNNAGDCYASFGVIGSNNFSNFRIYDVDEIKQKNQNVDDLKQNSYLTN